jgi:hypothetical protein
MLTASARARAPERAAQRPALTACGAFLLYLFASVAIWGRDVVAHLGSRYVSIGHVGDPDYFRWALAWTPWAIAHGRSPLTSDLVFAPQGVDLQWTTIVPGPAIVAWPVTKLFGTLVSYNVLMLLGPALAGWGAFLVCRRVTHQMWPSFAGGAVFGLSSYMAGQMQSHLNLVLVFPVALVAYLVIRRIEGSIGWLPFLVWTSVSMLGLFSISTELFATTLLFGTIAFVILLIAASEDRERVARAGGLTVAAVAIVGALVFVPYLLPALRNPPTGLVRPRASADLFGFVVPRNQTLVGGSWFASVSDRFSAPVGEDGSYLSIAGAILLVGFGVTERRRRGTWPLLAFVGAVLVLSLGAKVRVLGRSTVPAPGDLLARLPLIKHALACRFPVYASLAISVIAASWLARAHGPRAWLRWIVVAAIAVLSLPNVRTPPWSYPDQTPAFFSDGTYAAVIAPDENVAMITGAKGEGLLWQATTDFAFRIPWAWVGHAPEAVRNDQHIHDLFVEGARSVPSPERLAAALESRGVTAVVVGDLARPTYEPVVRAAGLEPVYEGGGVSVWRFPPD